jgi:HTH-type transcriptional regulator/antitoxin HigA
LGVEYGGVISPAVFCDGLACLAWKFTPSETMKITPKRFARLKRLWGAAIGTEEGDKLDILVTLVEKYEDRRWPNIDASDPIDPLNYAIEELGRSQAELAELLGSRSRASELLSRRRPLTVEMIHRISEAWKIPADLLVRPIRVAA